MIKDYWKDSKFSEKIYILDDVCSVSDIWDSNVNLSKDLSINIPTNKIDIEYFLQ